MNEYYYYLKSDIYKLRHSWFFWIHLLLPFWGAVPVLLYSWLSSGSKMNKMTAFTQLLAITFPFAISIVCQVVAEQELQAGHFQNMLTLQNRKKAIISKLSILLASGLFSVVLSTVLFGILFSLMAGISLPVGFFFFIPIVLWVNNIMMYGLHIILSFRFGRNPGISIGVIGSLLSALLQTGLGDGRWYVIPYGLGVRFTEITLMYIFQISFIINAEVRLGIIFGIFVTCGTIGLVIFWFSRYSGASSD